MSETRLEHANGVWKTILFTIALPIIFGVIILLWNSYSNRLEKLEISHETQKILAAANGARLDSLERQLSELRDDVKELLRRTPAHR